MGQMVGLILLQWVLMVTELGNAFELTKRHPKVQLQNWVPPRFRSAQKAGSVQTNAFRSGTIYQESVKETITEENCECNPMIWGTVGISDSLEYYVELDEMKMEMWFENAEEEVKEEMVGVVQILTDMGETKDL